MPVLPASLLSVPVAHRAYHDISKGRPENSRSAVKAAIAAGYAVELDLQLSSDGQAMVFHDYGLGRLTTESGPIRQRTSDQLQAITLLGSDETIPMLSEILDLIDGRIPVLIELKDQDGAMGRDIGALEQAMADAARGYSGDLAVMSFNPNSVARLAEIAPQVSRGITTSQFKRAEWPLSQSVRRSLREIPDFERTGAAFISHDVSDLNNPRVLELRAGGVPVLTWTVTSQAQAHSVSSLCDNITFEGFVAPVPT